MATKNSCTVDGSMLEYSTPYVFDGAYCKLQNIVFSNDLSFTNCDIYFKNVTLYGNIAINSSPFKAYDCEFSGPSTYPITFNSSRIEINRCQFSGYSKLTFGNSTLYQLLLQNNIFDGMYFEVKAIEQKGIISNNLFKNLFNNTNTTTPIVLINEGNFLSVVGNTFEVVPTQDRDITIVKFVGSGNAVKALLMESNSFWYNSSSVVGFRVSSIEASGYSDYGHRAVVRNNTEYDKQGIANNNTILRQTETTNGPILMGNYPGQWWSSKTGKIRMIFPYQEMPVVTATTYVKETETYLPTVAPYQITTFPESISANGGNYEIEFRWDYDNNKEFRYASLYLNVGPNISSIPPV